MQPRDTMGRRRFGRVNWIGLWTLYLREVMRFASIWTQTVLAPLVTSALFVLIFTLAFGRGRGEVMGIPFTHFLAPGIVMMAVIQNAFANTSSSLLIAKIQGNIVDTLMPPLSTGEILTGYALGGVTRGAACALATALALFPVLGVGLAQGGWAVAFVLAGSLMLALLGLLAGIYAEKFDQMAAITNFLITPLSFLSGTFYSIRVLPEPFLSLSHVNPFFYLIDGFRFGVTGVSDADPAVGLTFVAALDLVLVAVSWRLLAIGWRLKA